MERVVKIIQFISWPVVSGILLAIVYLQYQQLNQLSQQVELVNQHLSIEESNNSFSEAIHKASPSVVGITATRFDVESVELLSDCLLYTSPSPRDQRGSGLPGCG